MTEDFSEKFWLRFWFGFFAAFVLAVGCIVIPIMTGFYLTNKAAIEAGLEEGTIQGQPGVHWIKPKEK